ncbi:MAG: acetylxylan esterase [Bacteroidales bacterium]|nr:acetylxylan esterase [Bacteroidales bacterium]
MYIRKLFFAALLSLTVIVGTQAQNLLSPIWKYAAADEHADLGSLNPEEWPEINLLLSWERQGHSWMDPQYLLWQDFFVGTNAETLQLEFSLQGDVYAVYINQHQISEPVWNSFWTNRGRKTILNIPESYLKRGAKNEITIEIANLSYTGGKSYNFCSVHEAGAKYSNSISMVFPADNHVFLPTDKRELTLRSENISTPSVRVIINNDFHERLVDQTVKFERGTQSGIFDLTPWNLKPGIYECIVISEAGSFCGAVEWFAIQPEDIQCSTTVPDDFDAYWQDALDELQEVDPQFSMLRVDSLCSASRDGYVVEMKSLGNITIRAYYFVPKTRGKHPVVLHVPGYNYGFENLDGFTGNESDIAEMALCVRGHGISRDFFDPWDEMTLWAVNICNKEAYVYRSIYMDCVRAVDFLLSRLEIDPSRIGVAGGSQGGGLALATAGLCNDRIAACAVFDPFLCDIREHARIRTMINQELDSFGEYKDNTCNRAQMLSVLDYVDTKFFAPKIRCPFFFSTGLFDDDCPPHLGFAAYNLIATEKNYKVYPKDSHLGESNEYGNLYLEAVRMMIKED